MVVSAFKGATSDLTCTDILPWKYLHDQNDNCLGNIIGTQLIRVYDAQSVQRCKVLLRVPFSNTEKFYLGFWFTHHAKISKFAKFRLSTR